MIEPLHGVTRDTTWSGPAGERRPATFPVAQPLPTRRAAPPAGPDLRDQRYAALAAWSASAETITMSAVEVGPGVAYPRNDRTNRQPAAAPAGRLLPPAGRLLPPAGRLLPPRGWIAVLAVLAVLALFAAVLVGSR